MLLLSGGIDSPVAGYLLQESEVQVGALHFSLEPFTDRAPEEKAQRLATLLGFPTLHVARIGDALAEMARTCRHRYYFVLSKRFMFRVAEVLAKRDGAGLLITGESLGQVSSQTLQNLRAIDAAVTLPVLRPLIGWDKVEITAKAREIGTFAISKGPEVCDVLGPAHPATQARLRIVHEEEAKLPYEALLDAALQTVERVEAEPVTLAPREG